MLYLTLHQVADQLQGHWSTIRAAADRPVDQGGLRVVRLGKTAKGWRVDPADLADYLSRSKTPYPSESKPTEPTVSKPMLLADVLAEARQHLRKRIA